MKSFADVLANARIDGLDAPASVASAILGRAHVLLLGCVIRAETHTHTHTHTHTERERERERERLGYTISWPGWFSSPHFMFPLLLLPERV